MTTWLVSIATALLLLGASVAAFLTPAWVGFEQDRSGAPALTGYTETEVRTVTAGILGDLVLDRGDFDQTVAGAPVLTDAERSHMRDVRGVFAGFGALVMLAAVTLVLTWRGARERDSRSRWWRAARRGAVGLAVAIAALGVLALVAFDAAFEVFHRLFFAAGTYDFDPRTSRLVQLFPDQFWSETTIVVAALAIVLALAAAWLAARQLARGASARPDPAVDASSLSVRRVAR